MININDFFIKMVDDDKNIIGYNLVSGAEKELVKVIEKHNKMILESETTNDNKTN